MPTWDKILKELDVFQPLAIFDRYLVRLANYTKRTVICYFSAFTIVKPYPVPPPLLSIIDQDIQGFMTCSKDVSKDGLDLILHTPGGDYEATKRIINYLHETYAHIRTFVPHMAMSGGTLLACASDEIYIGPYSSLGPTDPQVFIGGRYVPAGAVVKEFRKAFEKVSDEPDQRKAIKKAILWNERLKQVPTGLIEALETMKENSNEYLKELLKSRNCRDKNDDQIEEIVKVLNSHEKHSSHSKGICLKEAQQLGLNVKDLRKEKELEERVLSVYHAAIILFEKTPALKIIANHKKRRYIVNYQPSLPASPQKPSA